MLMTSQNSKPKSEQIHPEITRLPALTLWRRFFRFIFRFLVKVVVRSCTRIHVEGLENLPRKGPLIIVSNHLGDADVLVGMTVTSIPVDIIVKSELYYYPVLGKILDAYGVIWVHRGQPDRRAVRVALESLRRGRIIGIAPEGRESLTGALEEGTEGAAYLALKSKAPVLPVTFTHTENKRILSNLKRFKRTPVTVTIGSAFYLDEHPNWRLGIEAGTLKIMRTLASQLPPEYQGVYRL